MRSIPAGRVVAGLAAAVIVTFGASACGGSGGGHVDKAKLVSKLKTDQTYKSMNSTQLSCVADVIVKYGNAGDINDYVNGKANGGGGIKKSDEKKATKDLESCVLKK